MMGCLRMLKRHGSTFCANRAMRQQDGCACFLSDLWLFGNNLLFFQIVNGRRRR